MAKVGLSSALAGASARRGGFMRSRRGLRLRGRYWHIAISHGGKTVRQSLETEDREQAERLYDKIRAELWEQKHLGKTPERLWEEAALVYVQQCHKEIAEGIRKTLDAHRLAWLNKQLTGTPLRNITRKQVKTMLKERPSKRHYAALVSAVLRAAVEEEFIGSKPEVMVGEPSAERTRWLAPDEAERLLNAAGYLRDAVLFSLATGLRQANVFGLRWSWIKDRSVMIPKDEFKQGREHAIPLNKTALECISRQIGKHGEFVFTREGTPLTKNNCKGRWYAAMKQAGIQDFRWHDLRHTWASYSLQNGVPLPIVEALGGWKSGRMVSRYAHSSIESLRPYTEVLDAVLLYGNPTVVPQAVAVK